MDQEVLEAAAKLVPKAFLSTSKDAQESRTKVFRILLEQASNNYRILFYFCLWLQVEVQPPRKLSSPQSCSCLTFV